MFRPMRRFRQQLSEAEAVALLQKATSGVLAVLGDDDYPYTVPLSYVYHDGKLYFHGAEQGHKVDAVRRCSKASFCVVDTDQVVPEEYTTYFRSVVAFGRIRILENDEEKLAAARLLGDRYNPGHDEALEAAIQKEWRGLCVMELTVEHLTGKEAIEFVRAKLAAEKQQ